MQPNAATDWKFPGGIMSDENKTAQIGADLVVRALEDRGVTHVFGIPGAKIDAVFNSLVPSKIETVVCRHEQNAAFIAGGIGRLTGKAGVCIATSGPGVSNFVTGLATANSEGDPLLALGGAVAVADADKHIHQSMDAIAIMKPVTKYAVSVGSTDQIAEVMANAFRAAEGGRAGASYVNLPMDVMKAPAPQAPAALPRFSGAGPADPVAIREAAKLINAASNPVVLLGMMASRTDAAAALQPFLTKGNLPVVGTFQAAGAVGASLLENFGGRVGQLDNQPGDELLDASDLIITVGYDPVEYWPPEWNRGKTRPIIHIDVLPSTIDADYQPHIELVGSIALTLQALTADLARAGKSALSEAMLQRIGAERRLLAEGAARRDGVPIHPLRLVHTLQEFLSDDVTVCLDMGSFHLWIARYMYSFRPRQILISNGQQTLGVALPWAIAASLVRPNEKVLSVSGDGGFLFSAMELETAVRLGTNIVHMVWIDGTYNMVKIQEELKYGRGSGVELGPIDYVKYAEAFGAKGVMIQTPDDILPVLKKAFDTPGPVIIGVHVDYSDNAKLFAQARENAFH